MQIVLIDLYRQLDLVPAIEIDVDSLEELFATENCPVRALRKQLARPAESPTPSRFLLRLRSPSLVSESS